MEGPPRGRVVKGRGRVRGRMEGVQPSGTERFYVYINILNLTLINKLEKCFIYSHNKRSIYLKSSLGYIRLSCSILLRCPCTHCSVVNFKMCGGRDRRLHVHLVHQPWLGPASCCNNSLTIPFCLGRIRDCSLQNGGTRHIPG